MANGVALSFQARSDTLDNPTPQTRMGLKTWACITALTWRARAVKNQSSAQAASATLRRQARTTVSFCALT